MFVTLYTANNNTTIVAVTTKYTVYLVIVPKFPEVACK